MIIHQGYPCTSCEHYSADTSDENHWVCAFGHDTCPHVEELHKVVDYKDAEVLDKIRAEIEHIGKATPLIGTNTVIEIIDKYKAESEVNE